MECVTFKVSCDFWFIVKGSRWCTIWELEGAYLIVSDESDFLGRRQGLGRFWGKLFVQFNRLQKRRRFSICLYVPKWLLCLWIDFNDYFLDRQGFSPDFFPFYFSENSFVIRNFEKIFIIGRCLLVKMHTVLGDLYLGHC